MLCSFIFLILLISSVLASSHSRLGSQDAAKALSDLRLKAKQASFHSVRDPTSEQPTTSSSGDQVVVNNAPTTISSPIDASSDVEKDDTNNSKSDSYDTPSEPGAFIPKWSDSYDIPSERGEFIPFNKDVPRVDGVSYYIATGKQECQVCRKIISNSYLTGPSFYDLCAGLYPEHSAMCHTQQKALQNCQEFTNDWCYQDLGGSQKLVAPCPDHLKCHYCLGLNPMNCL